MDGTVLVADDDRSIRTVLNQALTRAGCKVHVTASLTTLMRWVSDGRGDVVVTDVIMPDGNGMQMLPLIAKTRPDLPVIVISAQNTLTTAIQAEEARAFDYLPKPFDLPELMKRVGAALEEAGRARAGSSGRGRADRPARGEANDSAGPRDAAAGGTDAERQDSLPLVGGSQAMQALYRQIARILHVDLPVLIQGESGTGKSLVARVIHDHSDRRNRPFVVVDADALSRPDGIATALSRGRGGSLLIEEVADLDPAVQARLARAMDDAPDADPAHHPRILATTGQDMSELLREGRFREDLYYRLGGVVMTVPPLRARVEDIAPLARHFLAQGAADALPERRLAGRALDRLAAFPWPGNVRQLRNVIRRLMVLASQDRISVREVEAALADFPAPPEDMAGAETGRFAALVEQHLRRHFELHGGALPPPGLYHRVLPEFERPLIEIALEATGGNQVRCAELLGINRNTLRKKIRDLDIRVTRRRKLM